MTADSVARVQQRLRRMQRGVRSRIGVILLLRWLPWLALLMLLAHRLSTLAVAVIIGIVGGALLAALIGHRARQINQNWLIRHLDASKRTLQDSSDLLFSDAGNLTPLQALQRTRMQQSLLDDAAADLRPSVPWRALCLGGVVALLLALLLTLWRPALSDTTITATSTVDAPTVSVVEQSLQATLAIAPPAYTRLPKRDNQSLDAEVAQGSVLSWSLQFAEQPTAVTLQFVDGEQLDMVLDGTHWRAERAFDSSNLYRIETEGAAPLPTIDPYRIEVRDDRAPKLTIFEPQRTLTVLDAQSRDWQLRFDASDDYALGAAELQLTLAQGNGEQIAVSERRVALRGTGDAQQQSFDHRINLAALQFARGDDLIARIEVSDQRQPQPNISRSASFILRWPAAPASDGSGVEGLVQQTLPAYFRSQRQIIIDTEALVAESTQLSADETLDRSDAIGVDQRILRMRYGQFLGEESEGFGAGGHDDAGESHEHDDEDHDEAGADGSHDHDSHQDSAAPTTATARDLMAAAGHLHDIPEAATLLDPATKRLLRAALDAMWQSERELRLGQPAKALPHERRALDNIKRVQQASRIYLARVGLELPELDSARRLTGDRPEGWTRVDPLTESDVDRLAADAWRALVDGESVPLDELAGWINSDAAVSDRRLELLAAIDALRRTPDCAPCRQRLADQLWPTLPPPAATPPLRERSDATGRAYLDALSSAEVAQ